MVDVAKTEATLRTLSFPRKGEPIPCTYLEVRINGIPVIMKIDSGCHDSLVSLRVWRILGQPQLVPSIRQRRAASGVQVDVRGYFMATVFYRQRIFTLPLHVSGREDTRSLIGRGWFSSLQLNWNRVFHRDEREGPWFSEYMWYMRPPVMRDEKRTKPFYVFVMINAQEFRMLFDSGSTHSQIGRIHWEQLGRPLLRPVHLTILDTANNPVELKGEFTANVSYEGKECNLPVLVTDNSSSKAVIGTNWYSSIKFDFNSIFQKSCSAS